MTSLLAESVASLKNELKALPHTHTIAFAALVTERLYPYFEEFSKCAHNNDFVLFQRLLESVWEHVLADARTRVDFSKLKAECYGIELTNEGGESKYPGCDPGRGAIDAVGALYQTLDLCEGANADSAAKAAEIAMERIWGETERNTSLSTERIESIAFSSSEMQREINVQKKQLARLKTAKAVSEHLIAELRTLSASTNTH